MAAKAKVEKRELKMRVSLVHSRVAVRNEVDIAFIYMYPPYLLSLSGVATCSLPSREPYH